jgi:hypothetical protein
MPNPKKPLPAEEAESSEHQEIHSEDFQFVLKHLLAAYQPILEEDLKRAKSPEELKKEAESKPASCEDEVTLANRIFEKFVTEEVAVRLLPEEGRRQLGPIENWRWCFLHIRCCIIFGWLLCRRQRTFRAFAYYLHRYWLCVRQVLGTPVSHPPTAEEREDFQVLVKALASAYKPYLTDQLASVEFPTGIPGEVLEGKIDCLEGEEEAAAIFERMLTVETAPALLGRKAFEVHSKDPNFWFCRCWCLCAIRFGCCLAHARNLIDVLRCLRFYRRCLRQCFHPITCELTGPTGCVAEQVNAAIPAFVVPITGTAGGAGFVRYVLEWSLNGIMWNAANFVYPPVPPGNTVQGNVPVFGGLLAYLDTTLLNAGTYFVRMTVYGVSQAAPPCGPIIFQVFKKDVRITGVDGNFTLDTNEFDPAARFMDNVPALCARPAGSFEASFGTCLSVWGSAYIAGCDDSQKIKRYSLAYKPGYETDCTTGGWTNFWTVDFNTAAQYRAINMRTDTSVLTANWGPDCLVWFLGSCLLTDPLARLYPSSWITNIGGGCQLSGLYTIRLVVEDTLTNTYCDTQRVWLDNKPITALIQIDAVPKCADLFVSQFAKPPDCTVPWGLPVSGIAYDEYIDETLPLTRPNDNFDNYVVWVEKQSGPSISIPIPGPGGTCFFGTSRVGDPGTRCGVPTVPTVVGTLALFDLRAVDPVCKTFLPYPVPDAFTVGRGECCVYVFHLTVYDRTARPCGVNWATADWPVKICNDLPKP